jgi:hypothetical protein
LNELYNLNNGCHNEDTRSCNENTYKVLIDNFVTHPNGGTLYSAKFSSIPDSYVAYYSDDHFIEFLKSCSKHAIENKDDSLLISPAIFNPNKCQRGIDNIEYIRGIWLDFEDGDLKPDEIPKFVSRYSNGRF